MRFRFVRSLEILAMMALVNCGIGRAQFQRRVEFGCSLLVVPLLLEDVGQPDMGVSETRSHRQHPFELRDRLRIVAERGIGVA